MLRTVMKCPTFIGPALHPSHNKLKNRCPLLSSSVEFSAKYVHRQIAQWCGRAAILACRRNSHILQAAVVVIRMLLGAADPQASVDAFEKCFVQNGLGRYHHR